MVGAWADTLRTAVAALRAHKLRSSLTMLGIIIAVVSVIGVSAIIRGLNQHIANQVQNIGARTIFVTRFPAFSFEQWPEEIRLRQYFTYDNVRALRERCTSCVITTPFLTRALFFGHRNEVRFRNQKVDNPFVRGAEPEMPKTVPVFVVKEGRMFSEYENEHAARVAVIGLGIADSLFGRLDPVGQTVRLNGMEFKVIGVWEQHSGLFGGPGVDQFVIIPYKTFTKLWPEIEEVIIAVTVDDPKFIAQAKDEITQILRRERRVPYDAKNDFEISSSDFLTDLWNQLTGAIVLLTLIISSIGLVVGGIGVMNIMLVSVTERTAEIGLRKAVGARRRDIRRQFLAESVALTSLGGVLGILLGAAGTALTRWLVPTLPAELSFFWVATAFTLAVGVGLFFGIYPAVRASTLAPVACLRYE